MRSSRLAWVALGVAALVFVAAGLSRISFNVEILKLLPTHLPQVEGLSIFLKHFSQPTELIVTIEADTPEIADAAADAIAAKLSARTDLVKRVVARPPWEVNPATFSELLAFLVLNQPQEKIDALLARVASENTAATLKTTLEKLNESVSPQEIAFRSYDPFDLAASAVDPSLLSGGPQSEFASTDGTFRVVYVEAPKPFGNYKATAAWIDEIKRLTSEIELYFGVKLGFTGEPAFVADISSSTEWDMKSSGFVTLIVIALIFWLCYRRARPLFDLQAMLVLIFTLTLATAGLFLSELTVIGVGCAAIMIGLSVDYGYFVFQRAQGFRGSVRELQRLCVQNIAWTASTTAAVFFALNASSLPGLSQLGNLVGIGVIIGACVMLGVFAPLTVRFHRRSESPRRSLIERWAESPRFLRGGAWVTLAIVAALLAGLAVKGLPKADFSSRTLRPRVSGAQTALERLQARLVDERDFVSLIISGANEDEVLARLRTADAKLKATQDRGDVKSFRTALPLWPDPARQHANLPRLSPLITELPRLRESIREAGFNDEAFALTEAVVKQWAAWSQRSSQLPLATPIWPENETSRWIFRRIASRGSDGFHAMGMITPAPGREEALDTALRGDGVRLASWTLLGAELKRVIPREFANVTIGLAIAVLAIVAIGFRSVRAVGLFFATTVLVLLCLAGAMSILGMTWNFFNLAAVLLLLGTGTDYSILLLLALRRNGGDAPAAQRELALVICLCASSAAAGFGTISWANNAGLASLGQTCALGLVIDALVSLFLLPPAWAWLHRSRGGNLTSVAAHS
jgi:uncharacterized protein